MTINKQLFANNAKTTLLATLNSGDLSMNLASGQGALFPTGLTTGQYFLVTVESSGSIEIIKCTGRTGDTLTIAALGRAQEGTVALTFPVGSVVEMRVTRDTLGGFAKSSERLFELNTLDLLDSPANSDGNSYLVHSNDDNGYPIYAFKNTTNKWFFPSHNKLVVAAAVTSGTNSSTVLTSTSVGNLVETVPASGKYIIHFLTLNGLASGLTRLITGATTNQLSWSPALPASVIVTDTFEVYQSNSSIIALVASLADDSLVNSIIFGES